MNYFVFSFLCGTIVRSWPYCFNDAWMATHSQVIVAAPNRHLWGKASWNRVILSKRINICKPIHCFKDAVGVVIPLLNDLLGEEVIIVKTGSNWMSRKRNEYLSNLKNSAIQHLRVQQKVQTNVVLEKVWWKRWLKALQATKHRTDHSYRGQRNMRVTNANISTV